MSVLASLLRASNHDSPHGGGCWIVPSSSWVPFFDTVGPWCLSSSLSSALGLAQCSAPVIIVVRHWDRSSSRSSLLSTLRGI